MKIKIKYIVVFFLTSFFIFINCFLTFNSSFYNSMIHVGETECSFNVLFSTEIKSNDEIYNLLTSIANKYKANLYCSNIVDKEGKQYYIKYIYVSNQEVFKQLTLDSGRFYKKDENESSYFLSTTRTDKAEQIGIIASFSKNKGFVIKTLKSYFNENISPLDKSYVIELSNYNDLTEIKKELKQKGIVLSEQINDFQNAQQPSYYIIISIITAFVLGLLIMYDLIKSYKKIGIKKLLGYDNKTIFFESVPQLIFCQFVVSILTSLLFGILLVNKVNQPCLAFVKKLAIYYIINTLIAFILITLPFLFVKHVSISNVLKNKKPYKSIITFNLLLKFGVSILVICIICFSITDLKTIYMLKSDNYSNWTKTKSFAYVPVIEMPKDSTWTGESEEDMLNFKQLYKYMNSKGSIYADFSIFSPLYEDDQINSEFPVNNTVYVNPNYLKMFPIYDYKEEQIFVSENVKECIILAPEKYKTKAKQIESYFRDYGATSSIRIIWMKNNQAVFTFSLDSGIEDNNTVQDPVICVLTENNGDVSDYSMILGETGGPFKIKVNNPDNATAEIAQICSKFYDENEVRFPAVSVYKAIEEQIEQINTNLLLKSAMIIMLIIMFVSIVSQNTVAYINQNQKRLSIKRLCGFSFKDRYISYFYKNIIIDIGAFLLSIIFTHKISEPTMVALLLICFEIIFSYFYIKAKETANFIYTLKGGC